MDVPSFVLVFVDIVVVKYIYYGLQCPVLVGDWQFKLLLDPLEYIGHVSDHFLVQLTVLQFFEIVLTDFTGFTVVRS